MKRFIKFLLIITAIFTCAVSTAGCTITLLSPDFLIGRTSAAPSTSVDAAKMTNDITTDKIHALFTVYAENQKSKGSTLTAQGSAVAFYQNSDGYVFLLTNCHVAVKREDYRKVSYEVVDYAGNTYTAELYKSPDKDVSAISADYDLAVLYFKANTTYTTLGIASADPAIGETIVALGAPENQSNAITFGKVVSYVTTEVDADPSLSNVQFSVIYHDAFIDSGSSGGPIINSNYEIVGINYGGSEDNTVSLAVPATKVMEFMNTYVYE